MLRPDGASRDDKLASSSSSISEEMQDDDDDIPCVTPGRVARDLLMDDEEEEEVETVDWKPAPPPQRLVVPQRPVEVPAQGSPPKAKGDWEVMSSEKSGVQIGPQLPVKERKMPQRRATEEERKAAWNSLT